MKLSTSQSFFVFNLVVSMIGIIGAFFNGGPVIGVIVLTYYLLGMAQVTVGFVLPKQNG